MRSGDCEALPAPRATLRPCSILEQQQESLNESCFKADLCQRGSTCRTRDLATRTRLPRGASRLASRFGGAQAPLPRLRISFT